MESAIHKAISHEPKNLCSCQFQHLLNYLDHHAEKPHMGKPTAKNNEDIITDINKLFQDIIPDIS